MLKFWTAFIILWTILLSGCSQSISIQPDEQLIDIRDNPVVMMKVDITYFTVSERVLNYLCQQALDIQACYGLASYGDNEDGIRECDIFLSPIEAYEDIRYFFYVLGHEIGHCYYGNHHEWIVKDGKLIK